MECVENCYSFSGTKMGHVFKHLKKVLYACAHHLRLTRKRYIDSYCLLIWAWNVFEIIFIIPWGNPKYILLFEGAVFVKEIYTVEGAVFVKVAQGKWSHDEDILLTQNTNPPLKRWVYVIFPSWSIFTNDGFFATLGCENFMQSSGDVKHLKQWNARKSEGNEISRLFVWHTYLKTGWCSW